MTPEERELLETTARSLLKLQEEVLERISGMEIMLQELLHSNGRDELTLARLAIKAGMKGTPSAYLEAFLEDPSLKQRVRRSNAAPLLSR